MALIHGRSAEGEEVKSTNPVLIGAKDINGNAILLTTDAEGKLRVATDLEIASVTATDVTIHDPTTPGNKLKINADGSLPVQLSGSNVVNNILLRESSAIYTNWANSWDTTIYFGAGTVSGDSTWHNGTINKANYKNAAISIMNGLNVQLTNVSVKLLSQAVPTGTALTGYVLINYVSAAVPAGSILYIGADTFAALGHCAPSMMVSVASKNATSGNVVVRYMGGDLI